MRTPFRPGSLWSCLTLATAGRSGRGCGKQAETGPPPPPDVGVAQPIKRDVTLYSEHLGLPKPSSRWRSKARVSGELEQNHLRLRARLSRRAHSFS